MCGGTRLADRMAVGSPGLSPRVRGNLSPPVIIVRSVRSIPACAGEPPLMDETTAGNTVYPRVCGGTHMAIGRDLVRMGLSPRVRGNRQARKHPGDPARSIPACAGEPRQALMKGTSTTVYPRVCGGTFTAPGDTVLDPGLSPRVRGNLPKRCPRKSQRRSIPACAGEPSTSFADLYQDTVYPPRVRGNPCPGTPSPVPRGSIPACAGEPIPVMYWEDQLGVYPRVCGGTSLMFSTKDPVGGLSPRVRGNRSRLDSR